MGTVLKTSYICQCVNLSPFDSQKSFLHDLLDFLPKSSAIAQCPPSQVKALRKHAGGPDPAAPEMKALAKELKTSGAEAFTEVTGGLTEVTGGRDKNSA